MAGEAPSSAGPMPSNPAELEVVLMTILTPDTVKVKMATDTMKVFMENPDCVPALLQQIANSGVIQARQMAAVLLRKKLPVHFRKLPEALQVEIKGTLLSRLAAEPQRSVRLAIAALISSLARRLVPKKLWNELLEYLLQCSRSEKVEHREVAMLLFRALAEDIGVELKPHFKTLLGIFMQALRDSGEAVRLEGLRAIGVMVDLLDPENKAEVEGFREVVPLLVDVVQKAITAENDDAANVALGVFDTLASSPVPVLTPSIPLLTELMVKIASAARVDVNVRDKAASFLCAMLEAHGQRIFKAKLTQEVMRCGLSLAVEPYEDEQFEAYQMTPQKLAFEVLNHLVKHMPKKSVFEPLVTTGLQLTASKNPHDRKGGLVVLAIMAEECSELMKDKLAEFLPLICGAVADSEAIVRAAAAVALTQFADYCQPEVLNFHKLVLPHIFKGLENAREMPWVIKRLCTAMDVYCENLGKDIRLYIEPMMRKLAEMVQSGHIEIAKHAVLAIRSVALSAKEDFLPYFPSTIEAMGTLMAATDDSMLKLRAKATECVGAIANAVGKERFGPLMERFMKLACAAMEFDVFELRESVYHFFGLLAQTYEKDFCVLLSTVMPFCLATCHSDDGVMIYNTKGALDPAGDGDDGLDGIDSDDEDGKDQQRKLNFSIRTGALDEKLAAVACIGTICSSVGAGFLPFLEKTMEALHELAEYPHHHIRLAVIAALNDIVTLMHETFPSRGALVPGKATPLHENTQAVVSRILPDLVLRMTEEEDKGVAASAAETITECIRHFGLGAIQGGFKPIYEATLLFLRERAPCQRPDGDDEPEEVGPDEKDHDEVVIDSITDLVAQLAACMGPDFEVHWRKMLEPLMKFAQSHRPVFDRSMAIGCIAEVSQELGPACLPYIGTLLPFSIASLSDDEVTVRRNAAFCVGVLCMAGPSAMEFYPAALSKLALLFDIPPEDKRAANSESDFLACRDNATSAVARMITVAAAALPLPQVIPLFLRGLPLGSDFAENKFVYPALMKLFAEHSAATLPFLPQVVPILARALTDTEYITPDVQNGLLLMTRALCTQLKPQMEGLIGSLPVELRDRVVKVITDGLPPATAAPPS